MKYLDTSPLFGGVGRQLSEQINFRQEFDEILLEFHQNNIIDDVKLLFIKGQSMFPRKTMKSISNDEIIVS